MADFDALERGLKLFRQGMTQLGVTRAMSQAQDQIQQINAMEVDEMEKRKKLGALAQGLTMQLTANGTDPQQIAQVYQSIAPTPIKSAEDAFLQGAMTGSEELKAIGQQTQGFQIAPELEEKQKTRDWQSKENALNREAQLQNAAMATGTRKSKIDRLPPKMLEKIDGFDNTIFQANDLLSQLQKKASLVGPAAARIPMRQMFDKDFAPFKQQVDQWFNQYRKEITGSAAAVQELESLREAFLNEKMTVPEFTSKANNMVRLAKAEKNRFLKTRAKAGYEVAEYDLEPGVDSEAGQQVQAPPAAGTVAPSVSNRSNWFK